MAGRTVEAGYGQVHRILRAWWKPHVDAGEVYCHARVCLMRSRWIRPGTQWHLGHTPERDGWTGPEHAKCNCSDGGKRGNPPKEMRMPRAVRPVRTTQDW